MCVHLCSCAVANMHACVHDRRFKQRFSNVKKSHAGPGIHPSIKYLCVHAYTNPIATHTHTKKSLNNRLTQIEQASGLVSCSGAHELKIGLAAAGIKPETCLPCVCILYLQPD